MSAALWFGDVWFGDDGVQRALLLLLSLFVAVITELLNTGLEVVVDRIGTDWNELSGRAKDLGSASVYLSLVQVPVIWGLVLFG